MNFRQMRNKIILFVIFFGVVFAALNWYLSKSVMGFNSEGLFKIGRCLRNDEFGVTYKVEGTAKGTTLIRVIASAKYPSQDPYKIGYEEHIPSDENPLKLYPIPCL